ncbi:hypothetical protein CHS0354_020943 [Potamilus streckersoni]|uniref:ShKT domain-containing protein n=1 Tax=Potamilus streckersoni TaxID=2493646 RepID=A0AAE0SR46_9BIVA|nr:hypothetical protein CHS0354_020943 [Potamilus streckersoni]
MARCDQLKELICLDHAKATQFCPRTCNLCGAKSTIGVTSMTSATRMISTPPPTITQGEASTSYKRYLSCFGVFSFIEKQTSPPTFL